jgi:ABC-2 type transport system permease protein
MTFPSIPALFVQQVRYQLLTFVRSPVGMFFTLGLPVVMLVLFNALFGGETVDTPHGEWSVQQFYTGGLAAFTAVSATYTNLVNVVPIRRDAGTLKRWRSTPIPTGVYIAGWVAAAIVIAAAGVLLQLLMGVLLYDLEIEAAKLPALAVTFVVGVAAFAAMGMGVAALVPNEDSAPAVANATILPLAFISDTFIPIDADRPGWLEIADWLPLKPFVNAFQDALNPLAEAPAIRWGELAVVAAWGVAGAALALTKFRWEPAGTTTRPSRTRRTRRGSRPDLPA